MMDPSQMYPKGINPLVTLVPFFKGKFKEARHRDRIDVDVRYVIIDFGLSTKFTSFEDRKLVQFEHGYHDDLPEFFEKTRGGERTRTAWYDPFKADIAALGREFAMLFQKVVHYLLSS